MQKLPTIDGQELLKFLSSLGFVVVRTRGSHLQLRAEDGRSTTIPLHAKREVPKGLLRKIIRDDLEMSLEEFLDLFSEYRGR
ncbi:type II toxin-antitoxin system HicA family toxin [Methanothrix harundinacea]|uniref:YcfA-like protein n=1 Tax=Methanothrix harundinacea (strain 6Ac) TaxID=1110509 RepID=G7WME3_METH6|nr:type II toxin-antitoxin system HicA family toxin [Methanothrix harundinacea]AET64438.1 YcfA-like protein [Methanothrix harundinacea 6Ac]